MWTRHKRITLVESEWINHHLDTLELPSGKKIDYHALEFPMKVAGVIPVREDGKILLTLQYRYMANRRSWEIPAGNMDKGEDLIEGARRELIEETGYDAASFEHIYEFYPQIGRSDHYFNVYVARNLKQISEKFDTDEVCEIRWFTLKEVQKMLAENEIVDGFTATAILMYKLKLDGTD